jgi:regulatory protein
MSQITKLTPQQRNPNRVNVFVDEKFYCGLPHIVALKLNLRPGLVLDKALNELLAEEQARHLMWEHALKLLQISPKSRWELTQRLRRKFPEQDHREVVDRLTGQGLIDDTKLAKALVERYLEQQRLSRRAIHAKLMLKRIEPAIIEQAMTAVEAEGEQDVADKLAKRKATALRNLPERERNQKVAAYLGSRGFGYGIAKRSIERLKAEDVSDLIGSEAD